MMSEQGGRWGCSDNKYMRVRRGGGGNYENYRTQAVRAAATRTQSYYHHDRHVLSRSSSSSISFHHCFNEIQNCLMYSVNVSVL